MKIFALLLIVCSATVQAANDPLVALFDVMCMQDYKPPQDMLDGMGFVLADRNKGPDSHTVWVSEELGTMVATSFKYKGECYVVSQYEPEDADWHVRSMLDSMQATYGAHRQCRGASYVGPCWDTEDFTAAIYSRPVGDKQGMLADNPSAYLGTSTPYFVLSRYVRL